MKYKNIAMVIISLLLFLSTANLLYFYHEKQAQMDRVNICADDELIAKLIVDNSNPFSKFKFIKKRNTDCKILLIENSDKAKEHRVDEFCPYLDASTNSVTMLVYTYVHDMYDRETASKELKKMVPLMMPYDYCPQYYGDMMMLVKLKKRMGL